MLLFKLQALKGQEKSKNNLGWGCDAVWLLEDMTLDRVEWGEWAEETGSKL